MIFISATHTKFWVHRWNYIVRLDNTFYAFTYVFVLSDLLYQVSSLYFNLSNLKLYFQQNIHIKSITSNNSEVYLHNNNGILKNSMSHKYLRFPGKLIISNSQLNNV